MDFPKQSSYRTVFIFVLVSKNKCSSYPLPKKLLLAVEGDNYKNIHPNKLELLIPFAEKISTMQRSNLRLHDHYKRESQKGCVSPRNSVD